MFKDFSFENIFKSKSAIGIEYVFMADGLFEINFLVIKKKKSIVVIEKCKSGITNFDELFGLLDVHLPIVLIFNGKGIIHRKVNCSEDDTLLNLISKVLPNADVKNFYLQSHQLSASLSYLSVVRKSLVDDILDKLKTKNNNAIISCFLGPFVVENSLPLIEKMMPFENSFCFNNYLLQIQENKIIDIRPMQDSNDSILQVGNEKIASKYLISFSGALSYFLSEESGLMNCEKIDALRTEYFQKEKFKQRSMFLLIFSFLILVVNYLVFNNYWTKSNLLSDQLSANSAMLYRSESLKKEFEQKKQFLEKNGLLDKSKTSYYADMLAIDLPNSILWTDLNIHPLKKKQNNDTSDGYFFEKKIILLSGKSQRSLDLNEWIKLIKKKKWIEDVVLLNYNQENLSDAGMFLIQIKLR